MKFVKLFGCTDERLHQPSCIGTIRPLRQFDFRRVGGVAVFKVKSDLLDSLGLEFRGLGEPVPFSLGFTSRALTALSFQLAQVGGFFHCKLHSS